MNTAKTITPNLNIAKISTSKTIFYDTNKGSAPGDTVLIAINAQSESGKFPLRLAIVQESGDLRCDLPGMVLIFTPSHVAILGRVERIEAYQEKRGTL